jgi:hypothetical protein
MASSSQRIEMANALQKTLAGLKRDVDQTLDEIAAGQNLSAEKRNHLLDHLVTLEIRLENARNLCLDLIAGVKPEVAAAMSHADAPAAAVVQPCHAAAPEPSSQQTADKSAGEEFSGEPERTEERNTRRSEVF